MKFKLLPILTFIMIFCACQTAPSAPTPPGGPPAGRASGVESLQPTAAGEVLFQGIVVENDFSCEVDGWCQLRIRLDADQQLVTVVYHYGEWPLCENDEATTQGLAMIAGDRVEVFGFIREDSYVSTCENARYTIQKVEVRGLNQSTIA